MSKRRSDSSASDPATARAADAHDGHEHDRTRARFFGEFQRQLAMDRFRDERPQLWMQHLRVMKLVGIQEELSDEQFPKGSCFLHANTVTSTSFCVRRVTGIDLDTCQVSIEIYADEQLEAGIIVLPLETIEWFGFPATPVPVGVHFQGFSGVPTHPPAAPAASKKPDPDQR